MPDAGVLATILLIVGLFLLALELMIPSFGMIGILSALTLLISAWCAWQAWWGTSPGFFWTYAAFWLLGIPSVLGGALFLLQNTSLGDRLVLRGPAAKEPVSEDGIREETGLNALVGQIGSATSLLTPGGMVEVNNQRHHAESPGMVIEPGTPVEVVSIRSNRLVVRAVDPSQLSADKPAAEPTSPVESDPLAQTIASADIANSAVASDAESGGILDFDIPEN